MEQNSTPVQVPNKQSSGVGLKIVTAIAIIIAACGVGFGVYGMTQSTQGEKEHSQTAKGTGEETGAKCDDTGTSTTPENPSKKVNAEEYIYISEWGLKLKLPDGLHDVKYTVNNTREDTGNDAAWYASAGTSDLLIVAYRSAQDAGKYDSTDSSSCNSAGLIRLPKGRVSENIAFSKGDYDFVFMGWHAVCDEQSMPTASQTGGLLRKVITNPDNFTEI